MGYAGAGNEILKYKYKFKIFSDTSIMLGILQEFGHLWIRAYENIGEPRFDSLKSLFEYEPPPEPPVVPFGQWASSDEDSDSEDPQNSWDCRDV